MPRSRPISSTTRPTLRRFHDPPNADVRAGPDSGWRRCGAPAGAESADSAKPAETADRADHVAPRSHRGGRADPDRGAHRVSSGHGVEHGSVLRRWETDWRRQGRRTLRRRLGGRESVSAARDRRHRRRLAGADREGFGVPAAWSSRRRRTSRASCWNPRWSTRPASRSTT